MSPVTESERETSPASIPRREELGYHDSLRGRNELDHDAGFLGSHRQLYISHFLSTWNVRGFEFGAVLFLATIFPGTLLPMSVYALIRATAAILLSPLVGWLIDNGERLKIIRISIGKSSNALWGTYGKVANRLRQQWDSELPSPPPVSALVI